MKRWLFVLIMMIVGSRIAESADWKLFHTQLNFGELKVCLYIDASRIRHLKNGNTTGWIKAELFNLKKPSNPPDINETLYEANCDKSEIIIRAMVILGHGKEPQKTSKDSQFLKYQQWELVYPDEEGVNRHIMDELCPAD